MNKVIASVMVMTFGVLGCNVTQAADLGGYQDDYAGPVLLWSGFYGGVHVSGIIDGEAVHDFQPEVPVPGDTDTIDVEGLFAGAHLGYNAQFDRLVVGIEADAAFGKTDDPATCNFFNGRCESYINNLYSVRARLGLALRDNVLLYGTGGLAVADVEHTLDFGGSQVFEDSGTVEGVVYGGGIEYMHSSGITFGAEVLHYDFDTEQFNLQSPFGAPNQIESELDLTIVKGKVGFHFN